MDWRLTPGLLLRAYATGLFPMAESAGDPELHWVDPSRRGIMPIGGFHISRSLRRRILSGQFEVTFDTAFPQVVALCADRPETWINNTITELYNALFERGYGHSQEVWENGKLVGGVYGVALGAAFFGESMFSKSTDASKVALAYLMDRLHQTGFELFDTQFITPHLRSLGGIEIDRQEYLARLEEAVRKPADIAAYPGPVRAQDVIQRSGQTS